MIQQIVRSAAYAAAAVAFSGITSQALAQEPAAPRRPSVILIVSDDVGYNDLGFQGGKDIPTPHLDSIARNGVRYTNAYVTAPICGASRAGLVTGRYQQRHSYDANPGANQGVPVWETTMAEALQAGGYATAAFGKWHLGSSPEYRPLKRGFDSFYGFLGAGHPYIPGPVEPSLRMVGERPRRGSTTRPEGFGGGGGGGRAANGPTTTSRPARTGGGQGGNTPGVAAGTLLRNDEQVEESAYLTEAFAREAVRFIELNRTKPYFVHLAFNASHSPLQPPEKYLARFPNLQGKRKAYAATTSALDDAVGQVLAKVRELGQEEDTVIYYTNDNGGPINDITADNTPLSGAKFSTWEGGIRVPSVVQWKGRIPAGQVRHEPVISLDIFPTVLAAAGLPAPQGKKFEGRNLLPLLAGQDAGSASTERPLFWRYGQFWAIREGNWKLTRPERGEEPQLFDLSRDVAENEDLTAKYPEVAARLKAEWDAWNADNLPVVESPGRGGEGRRGPATQPEGARTFVD